MGGEDWNSTFHRVKLTHVVSGFQSDTANSIELLSPGEGHEWWTFEVRTDALIKLAVLNRYGVRETVVTETWGKHISGVVLGVAAVGNTLHLHFEREGVGLLTGAVVWRHTKLLEWWKA